MCRMCKPAEIRQFALAGNATFTLQSGRTGTRYTYRVRAPKDAKGKSKFFVSLLTGPDNTQDYRYIGFLNDRSFQTTKKSCYLASAKPVMAFDFFVRHVLAGGEAPEPLSLEFFHEGRCGRCNRLLTVPESIERGIGPECASKMGM